jgi:hypothetical protein
MANLDNTHDALVEAHTMTRQEFEDLLLFDREAFTTWATRYITATGGMESLLNWCWRRYQDEHNPAYTEAWKVRPKREDE